MGTSSSAFVASIEAEIDTCQEKTLLELEEEAAIHLCLDNQVECRHRMKSAPLGPAASKELPIFQQVYKALKAKILTSEEKLDLTTKLAEVRKERELRRRIEKEVDHQKVFKTGAAMALMPSIAGHPTIKSKRLRF